jgi:hypothetical protein
MATPYRLPCCCYALVTVLVLFFSVDATEGAIREYQFDVSMSACMHVCVQVQQSACTRLAPLPPPLINGMRTAGQTCSCMQSH